MKKIQLFVISLTVLLFASCGSSKKVAEKTAIGETRTEIKIPCEEYNENTKDAFRATASASSPNQQFAKDKAMGLARNALGQKIEISVQSLFSNYASQYDVSNEQEFKERTQAITRQVTDQIVNGLNAICQKDFTLSSGKYEVWIALEMPTENVGKSIYNKVSDDEKIRLDYDYEKFKDELHKEIEKKRNE
jgi:hypothetical protein